MRLGPKELNHISLLTRSVSLVVGTVFLVLAVHKDTRIRRKGSVHLRELTKVGRICLFLMGALSIFVGLTGITEFWRFSN